MEQSRNQVSKFQKFDKPEDKYKLAIQNKKQNGIKITKHKQ